ncbi:uncharacterized protein ZBAI_08159 [Zygosaccharomyces bailii ISA1307]|nr:uncharacterized protein ZBAI_08159 [Zygosaccharomyces bailii ISA1307]
MTRIDSAATGVQPTRSNLVNYWSRVPWYPKRFSISIGGVKVKRKLTRGEVAGSALNVAHLCSLMAYSIFGLTSSREENYPSSFVYGASLITFFSYFVLYCADVNKLSSSILEKEGKEGTGTYLAKVGVMGIILPVFNLIALIFLFMKIRQDAKTFWSGIAAFIFYFLGNTLLFFSKGENTESEEHELRENNLPADNTPVSNSS